MGFGNAFCSLLDEKSSLRMILYAEIFLITHASATQGAGTSGACLIQRPNKYVRPAIIAAQIGQMHRTKHVLAHVGPSNFSVVNLLSGRDSGAGTPVAVGFLPIWRFRSIGVSPSGDLERVITRIVHVRQNKVPNLMVALPGALPA